MGYENLFGFPSYRFPIGKKIKLIELFGGYGSQALALKYIGADYMSHRLVEIDPKVVKAYNIIHGTDFAAKSICDVSASDLDIRDDGWVYMMTYSFPCQDLSTCGLKQGMEEGSGTRSSLLWEVKRILAECDKLPDILLMENVEAIKHERNIEYYKQWILFIENLGYSSLSIQMNPVDYGVPQNRPRQFLVSVMGDYTFDEPKKTEIRPLELYYSDDDRVISPVYIVTIGEKKFVKGREKSNRDRIPNNGICFCITHKGNNNVVYHNGEYRELRGRTAMRLQGVRDEDIPREHFSANYIRSLAGNSISIDVLMAIYRDIFHIV